MPMAGGAEPNNFPHLDHNALQRGPIHRLVDKYLEDDPEKTNHGGNCWLVPIRNPRANMVVRMEFGLDLR